MVLTGFLCFYSIPIFFTYSYGPREDQVSPKYENAKNAKNHKIVDFHDFCDFFTKKKNPKTRFCFFSKTIAYLNSPWC